MRRNEVGSIIFGTVTSRSGAQLPVPVPVPVPGPVPGPVQWPVLQERVAHICGRHRCSQLAATWGCRVELMVAPIRGISCNQYQSQYQ